MKRFCSWLLIILCAALTVLAGCDGVEQEGGKPLIAVSLHNADEYRTAWINEFLKVAEAHNFDVIWANGEENMDKQIADIETMLLKSPDVIIIHNSENTGIIPTLYKIEEKDIPCILVDFTLDEEYEDLCDAVISDGMEEYIPILTEYASDWAGLNNCDINVGIIYGSNTTSDITGMCSRSKYFLELLDIDEPVAAENGYWRLDTAMEITESWIGQYPQLNVLVCMSDEMAIGAIQALTASGRDAGSLLVMSIDGMSDAVGYLKNGMLDCCAARDIGKEVETALDTCIKLYNGEECDRLIHPNAFYALTKENVDEYY